MALWSDKCGDIDENTADAAMSLKTWWAIPFVQPLSRKLVVFVVNRTSFTANHITSLGMIFRFITLLLFLYGDRYALVAGAFSYYLAYVCDCADGTVARIKKQSTELGRYLDHLSDLVGDILILLVLAWSQGLIASTWIWAMVFMHIAECYMSYLSGFALSCHQGTLGHIGLIKKYNRYRSWFFERNVKSFFSFPDYTALVFVVCPLLGVPAVGLQVGFYCLLGICLYTVLSTFVSIHSGENYFP